MNTSDLRYKAITAELKSMANPENVAGMARYGINAANTYGISIPNLRRLAKETGKDHALAQQLWDSGIHEARILASLVDQPELVTERQMELWVKDFDSWDVCDGVCSNLFGYTPFAWDKATEWSKREEEFVKRAGYVLMARLAVGDKKAPDEKFLPFFPLIIAGAADERNFVKKAVNWALRQIGKRNDNLLAESTKVGLELRHSTSPSARWVANDALREFEKRASKD